MNENIYKQPLVLFLGAGASASLGKKTTVEFMELLGLDSEIDKWVNAIKEIQSNVEPGTLDVEIVLDYMEDLVKGGKLLCHFPIDRKAISVDECERVCNKVKDVVFNHYSEIDELKASRLYSPLVKLAKLHPLPVFTTNYDIAIEKTYEEHSDMHPTIDDKRSFSLIDGFDRTKLTPRWSRSAYENYKPMGIDVIFFKLHGSVDWRRTRRGAIQRFESVKRDPEIVIAYPSRQKREIHEEPFRTNYDYLLACLLNAQICAVIGFSFRDQEIVEELRQAMALNKQLELMIIDPLAEQIEYYLYTKLGFKPNIDLIKIEFNFESAQDIANIIVDKATKLSKRMRVEKKKTRRRRTQPVLATEEVKHAVEEAIKPIKDELTRVTEYLDGLQKAPPKIRDPFLEARKLEKGYKYREAIKQYEACLQPETTASQRAALHILIGNCFYRSSKLEEAEDHYRQAETAAKKADNKEGLAAALGNIGNIYQDKGELDKALDYHQQSLNINQDIGLKEGEASELGNIGNIYQTKGELDKALKLYEQVLKIEREIGRKWGESAALGNIGLIYRIKGELDKAHDYHQQALKIDREIGRKEGEASDLVNIGNIYGIKGELDKALGYQQQALTINKEIGRKKGEAAALGNIGIIYKNKGELDKALDYHQQSLNINQDIGLKEGEASQLGNIGNIYQDKGELDKALDYHQQSLEIEREIGRKEGEASSLGNIGLIYQDKGELDKALDYLQQALKMFEEIGAKLEIEKTKQNIQVIVERMESSRGKKK